METGVYTRTVDWTSPRGKRSRLVFSRMASFVLPQLALIKVDITPLDWSGRVTLTSTQHGDVVQDFDLNDPRKASVGKKMIDITAAGIAQDRLVMAASTTQSGLNLASVVAHQASTDFETEYINKSEVNSAVFTIQAEKDQSLSLTKYCVNTDSRRFKNPEESSWTLMDEALQGDFAAWQQNQTDYLKDFWAQAGASVTGDEGLNASLNWSMYTLLSAAGKDGIGNIASKGLSGEGYEGHCFWDTEIYMFPFFVLTNPELARNLLDSRAAMLSEAFEHAKEMGHEKGALYAWRTITGSECSAYFPSGSAQYHINGAVAHAFLTYYQATQDLDYMAKMGAKVLVETARLWLNAGHWHEGQFRIDSVTGPDEYSCVVNNNYYTNRSAQYHLKNLVKLCADLDEAGMLNQVKEQTGLKDAELNAFQQAAEAMYLPYDETLGISAQDDAFLKKQKLDLSAIPRDKHPLLMHYHPLFLYRHQVCKQADTVLAHFLFEEGEREEVIKRSYDYYEGITTHDSSLSECVFAMMAARTNQVDKAFKYYRASAVLDLEDTHKNTADGIHAANMGGCWMGIVFGFGGLRLHEEGLTLRPCLPKEMEGYEFSLLWRGSHIKAAVNQGGISLELLSGPSLVLSVYGQPVHLKSRLNLPLNG